MKKYKEFKLTSFQRTWLQMILRDSRSQDLNKHNQLIIEYVLKDNFYTPITQEFLNNIRKIYL